MKLIDKDALVAEIERYKHKADERLKIKGRTLSEDCKDSALQNLCGNLLHFINTFEVKEVDLEKEIDKEIETRWRGEYLFTSKFRESAKHFFQLGLSVNNPITAADRGTAEEIILSLKQVENDYRIDHSKEIEWVRN